jgi:quinol monooxygenase YgiN
MKVYLTAFVKAKIESVNELSLALQKLVEHSRQEPACIQYDLHQGTDDPTVFIFHEIWESHEGLDIHNQQPYLKNFPSQLVDGGVAVYKTTKL